MADWYILAGTVRLKILELGKAAWWHLWMIANDGTYPCPMDAQIHVGSEDWQSGPEGVVVFGSAVGIPVTVLDGEGHMMRLDYVGGVLDKHLR